MEKLYEVTEGVVGKFCKLLRIDSRSRNIDGVNQAGTYISELLSELPIEWERKSFPEAPDFWIGRSREMDKNKPTVLLSGHHDVVPTVKEPRIEGDKIFASGAMDMKGGIISMVETVRELAKLGLCRNLIIGLNPEEELGSPHHCKTMVDLAKEADYVMVFESTSSLDSRSIVQTRKGAWVYEISIDGPGGHSGQIDKPDSRHSTVNEGARLVVALDSLSDYPKGTTINIGEFNAGEAINSLGAHSRMRGEFRFREKSEYRRVKAEFEKAVKQVDDKEAFKAQIKQIGFFPALYKTPTSDKFVQLVTSVATKLGYNFTVEHKAGSSDANHYLNGNPEAAVLDGFGVWGEFQHIDDKEYMDLRSLKSSIILATRVIQRIIT